MELMSGPASLPRPGLALARSTDFQLRRNSFFRLSLESLATQETARALQHDQQLLRRLAAYRARLQIRT